VSATGGEPALIARYAPEVVAIAREIFQALRGARRVLVTSEPYPDGDAFGTEVALDAVCRHAFALAGNRDARALLVNEKGCPRKYRALLGAEKIKTLEEVAGESFDVGIVVDGGAERAGPPTKAIFDRCKTRVYIDHHKFGSREKYDIALSDPKATSTTQLVYAFFADPEIAVPLEREAAEAIYLGLIYDTGSFQYPNTRPLTHEIAARLIESGIDHARIHERALLTQDFDELMVVGRVFASAERCAKGEIVHASLTSEFMREMHVSGDEFNRIIQTLCFIEGVECAVVFKEITPEPPRGVPPGPREWKLSLRSRGKVDVAAVARELDPHGGGHDRAAGCTLEGELAEVKAKALGLVEKRLAAGRGA
jgi:phosphoesterase RecJ-like protein